MTDAPRKRKKGEFVVRSKQATAPVEKLRDVLDLEIEAVDELPQSYVVRAKDAKKAEALTREALRDVVGEDWTISTVLEDDEGHTFIPTGKINVVMSNKLSKAKLREWSADHKLGIVQHSKWRPKAVLLEPESEDEDAVEAVERLKDDPSVELAEPDVLTRFKRE